MDDLRERMTAVVLARYGGLSDSSSIVENCIRVAQEAVDAALRDSEVFKRARDGALRQRDDWASQADEDSERRQAAEAERDAAQAAADEMRQILMELRTHPALGSWPGGGTAETSGLQQKYPSLWARLAHLIRFVDALPVSGAADRIRAQVWREAAEEWGRAPGAQGNARFYEWMLGKAEQADRAAALSAPQPCASCEGTGYQHNHNNDPVPCPTCSGAGHVRAT